MTTSRRLEIQTHLELGKQPHGDPPNLEELYEYILELEEGLEQFEIDLPLT